MISVIIPTCHRNDLLTKCLDCLSPGAQTLPADQYEVIVTDDGSKSTAEGLVREHYSWARWVAGPRRGPAANRNNGTKYATGEWLAFTDDDCLPSSKWLEAYCEAIDTDCEVYEGKTTCVVGLHSPLFISPINLTGGYLWSCNMMVSRRVFRELDGFDENFPYSHCEDVDFRKRLTKRSYGFRFINSAIVDHPPRRWPSGKKLGLTRESEIYLWYKGGNKQPYKMKLLLWVIRNRLALIRQHKFNRDYLLAIVSMASEVLCVATHLTKWNRKYRAMLGPQ